MNFFIMQWTSADVLLTTHVLADEIWTIIISINDSIPTAAVNNMNAFLNEKHNDGTLHVLLQPNITLYFNGSLGIKIKS